MSRRTLDLLIGPLLLFLAIYCLPASTFTTPERTALGTMLWMGWWWVTLPVNPGVTALLPIAVNALFNLVPMGKITSLYFSDIVVLLLGANIISATWELTKLDKRLALKSLCFLGSSLTEHVAAWFLIAVILSSVLPNAVVCALLTPIAISMLNFVQKNRATPLPNTVTYVLLVAIVWGCGLGGLGTPLGGAMNLVAISYIEQYTGHEFFYWDWVKTMFPFVIALTLLTLGFLLFLKPRKASLGESRAYFIEQYNKLPKVSSPQIVALILFLTPLVLSFLREFYAELLPGLKPAHLFLICALFAFVLPGKGKPAFATWKEVKPKIEWEILLLFAGGLALGHLLMTTGTTQTAARLVASLHLSGGFMTLVVICAITMFFVEVASNTAAAAIAIPMVIGIAGQLHLDTMAYIYATAVAFNTGFMMPTSIRAIPIAYGLDTKYLFKNGFLMTIATIIAIAALGVLLLL